MFERFTADARLTVDRAQELRRGGDLQAIDCSALLWGVLDPPGRVGEQLLRRGGVDVAALRQAGRGEVAEAPATPGRMPFTADAKECVAAALREALRLGHNYIGSEHIALALVSSASPARRALTEAGADLDRLRLLAADLPGPAGLDERFMTAADTLADCVEAMLEEGATSSPARLRELHLALDVLREVRAQLALV